MPARSLAALVVIQLFCSLAAAQVLSPSGGTDRSIWMSYFGDQPFAEHWAVHAEGSYRRTLGLSQFEQLELRPGVTIIENNVCDSLIAYTFFRSQITDGGSFGPPPLEGKQIENRLFEQQQIHHRLYGDGASAARMVHRLRLEQRWQSTALTAKGYADTNFSQRARYRLTVQFPLGRTGSPKHYWTAYNEVYSNTTLKKNTSLLNQDVTYTALGSRFGKHWAVEVGYQFRYSTISSGITGPEDHSVQVYLLSTAPFRHREAK